MGPKAIISVYPKNFWHKDGGDQMAANECTRESKSCFELLKFFYCKTFVTEISESFSHLYLLTSALNYVSKGTSSKCIVNPIIDI